MTYNNFTDIKKYQFYLEKEKKEYIIKIEQEFYLLKGEYQYLIDIFEKEKLLESFIYKPYEISKMKNEYVSENFFALKKYFLENIKSKENYIKNIIIKVIYEKEKNENNILSKIIKNPFKNNIMYYNYIYKTIELNSFILSKRKNKKNIEKIIKDSKILLNGFDNYFKFYKYEKFYYIVILKHHYNKLKLIYPSLNNLELPNYYWLLLKKYTEYAPKHLKNKIILLDYKKDPIMEKIEQILEKFIDIKKDLNKIELDESNFLNIEFKNEKKLKILINHFKNEILIKDLIDKKIK